jgi:hypothetical protein
MAGAPASTIVDFTQGNQGPGVKVNADGSINVNSTTTPASDIVATGAIAGNTSVSLALSGQASVEIQLVPTAATVTLNFEVSYDSAVTWNPLAVWPLGVTPQGNTITSLALAASSAEVVYQGGIAGATNVRVRGSGFSAGTVAVTIRASENNAVLLASAQVNQGSAAATAGAWPVKVTDGTNVAAVKAASTAAAATDPAEVVAISPNIFGQAAMANSLPVAIASNQTALPIPSGTLTDRSSTITAGGTAQTLAASNSSRKKLIIINPSTATESLWFNFTTAAVAASPSIELKAGTRYETDAAFISTELISVIAATTGHVFTAKEG